MGEFLQTLFVGLRLGSVYALIALGYTMVYGIIRLINFAHGDFIMVGGYTLFFTVPLMTAAGLPAWAAVVIAMAVCALVGVGVELVAYRPVRKKGTNMTALITAIAMSLFLENLAQAIPAIGPNPKIASSFFGTGGIQIAGVTLDYVTIYTIVISAVVMLLLYAFTQKTRMGRAMRCVSEDKSAAILMGISVNKTVLVTFAIGSGLAAVAALMYIAQYPSIYTTLGSLLGLKAFVAAVVGGIGIVPGAMLGGIVIGVVESFSMAYISSSLSDTFVFLILILVLLVKPAGILGKNVGEKV
ncbi:MAG TPA: branched-chain amino acid ABC transporter permease [Candidatus Scatomorpha pullicola]|nr:branched-chain amino acid ABC transporter permease [Candidatus Scatomorpha pullicola]